MRDQLLAAAAAGVASWIAVAVVKYVWGRLIRLLRGGIQLVREFRAFLKWRAHGGLLPPAGAGPGPDE